MRDAWFRFLLKEQKKPYSLFIIYSIVWFMIHD